MVDFITATSTLVAIAMTLILIVELVKTKSLRRFIKGMIGLLSFASFITLLTVAIRAGTNSTDAIGLTTLLAVCVLGVVWSFSVYYDAISMEWLTFNTKEEPKKK